MKAPDMKSKIAMTKRLIGQIEIYLADGSWDNADNAMAAVVDEIGEMRSTLSNFVVRNRL